MGHPDHYGALACQGPGGRPPENERLHVRQALAASGGRLYGPEGAAALLGINPSTLRSRLKRLGITKQRE